MVGVGFGKQGQDMLASSRRRATVERTRRNVEGLQMVYLVLHQTQQGANDNRHAICLAAADNCWQLVAKGLAASCWHENERIPA